MSFQTVSVQIDVYQQILDDSLRWLLITLASYANRDGRCWPGMRLLAARTRISLATISRRIAQLVLLGVITRERRPGKGYVYTINEAYRACWPSRITATKDQPKATVPAPEPDELADEVADELGVSATEHNQPIPEPGVPDVESIPAAKSSRPAGDSGVPAMQLGVSPRRNSGVPQAATQEVSQSKQTLEVGARATPPDKGARHPPADRDPDRAALGPDFKWRSRLRQLVERRLWAASYGPLPGQPGCLIPERIIAAMYPKLLSKECGAVSGP